ncbi:MAG: hypothetical protein MK171_09485 [Pirellulales bacterium]|nr:hypothetical protein [Pirellulales bacterium]
MKVLLQIVSGAALAATLLPAVFYLTGSMGLPQVKTLMLGAAIVWFIATPLWMGRGCDGQPGE